MAARKAILAGVLTRSACERCGAEKVDAHHEDYSRPLEVTWLCRRCHFRRHREMDAGSFSKAPAPRLTRLRAVRERKALSMQELADLAGVAKMTIYRLESGVHEPYPKTTRRIAAALGVEPHELMESS